MYKKAKVLMLSLFLVLAFSLTSAYADVGSGWYYGLGGGGAVLSDSDWNQVDNSSTGELEYDAGYRLNGAIGYKFGMPRVEAEILYLENDIDKVKNDATAVSGQISALGFMINGYLDFTNESRFTPFIMAGVGYANIEIEDYLYAGTRIIDDDDNVFAWQVGAGLGIDITENIVLDLAYKYFGAADQEYDNLTSTVNFENEYGNHTFTIGFRYHF